jgi:hypothetical protein
MKKIILSALTAKFGEQAILLADLCNNTSNPETAVELLLGVYETPTLPRFVQDKRDDLVRELVSVFPMASPSNVITYKTSGIEKRWFRNEAEALCNGSYRHGGNSKPSEQYVFEYDVNWVDTNNCSVERWLEMTPVVKPAREEEQIFG